MAVSVLSGLGESVAAGKTNDARAPPGITPTINGKRRAVSFGNSTPLLKASQVLRPDVVTTKRDPSPTAVRNALPTKKEASQILQRKALPTEEGAPRTTIRGAASTNKVTKILGDRQSCAGGTAFYVCQNGFTGCCSVDPCDPGGGCPDFESSGTTAASTTSATSTTLQTTSTSQTTLASQAASGSSSSASINSTSASDDSSTSDSASSSTTSTSTTASSTLSSTASSAVDTVPLCPAANNTLYTDSSSVGYTIQCNADNSAPSTNTVQVGVGGFSQCFSACSMSTSCAGFTYVGLDSGSCYLKASMTNSSYVAKAGSNYVSCAKLDPTAVKVQPTASPNDTSGKASTPKAAIAGGIVGGIAVLLLILALVIILVLRSRKKREEIRSRSTVTHVLGGAVEPARDPDGEPILPMHQRQASTGNDVFAPYGGAYYAPVAPLYSPTHRPLPPQMQPQPAQHHARQRSIYRDDHSWI